jgi:lipopolysaccharide export system protein LptA
MRNSSRRPQTKSRYVLLAAASALAALVLCGPIASAQQPAKNQGPANALQGFSQNREQPVKIVAASLEVREKDKVATFSGDVKVTQGDTEMRCRSLVVHYEEDTGAAKTVKAADPGPGGQQQISRIEAKGSVVVTQKDQNATGDNGIFDMRANTVTLTGNVVVTRGQDVLRGRRLVVNLTTGTSKMDGAEALLQGGGRPADPGRSADPLARSPEKK